MQDYTKAFVSALKDHLQDNIYRFTTRKYDNDGCPTCGHGATEYLHIDIYSLNAEIDKFSETFKK